MDDFQDFDDINDAFETIIMTGDNGEDIEFIIVDSVVMDDATFLLLIKGDEFDSDEAEAYIFKQVGEEGDDDVIFEEPTEEEFERVSELFRASMDDFDFED